MGRRRKENTLQTYRKKQQEGRCQGDKADFSPGIRTYEIPSLGKTARAFGEWKISFICTHGIIILHMQLQIMHHPVSFLCTPSIIILHTPCVFICSPSIVRLHGAEVMRYMSVHVDLLHL